MPLSSDQGWLEPHQHVQWQPSCVTKQFDVVVDADVGRTVALDAVAEAIKLPIFLGTLTPGIADKDYLASRRVRVALLGHPTFPAAVQAAYTTLKAQREGTPVSKLPGVASGEMMKKYTRDADYAKWLAQYLG